MGKAQAEVLRLIKLENLTVQEIAARRKTTIWAVYKILKRIGKKDSQTNESLKRDGLGGLPHDIGHFQIRLHGQEFNAKIYNPTDRFRQLIGRTFKLDGTTVRVFSRSVEIYAGRSFYGPDAEQANAAAWEYWQIFFKQLEKKLGCAIFKPAGARIRTVKVGHYAEIGNEMAIKAHQDRDKVALRGFDGREWFIIDNSFNLHEAETIHAQQARNDMQQVIGPFFTTLREEPRVLETLGNRLTYMENTMLELIKGLSHKFGYDQGPRPPAPPVPPGPTDRPDYMG